jgi:hypothetical protein
MKEIDGKLYGYSYELEGATGVDDLTEFRAVDSGELYIAFNQLWYNQHVYWPGLDGTSAADSDDNEGGGLT